MTPPQALEQLGHNNLKARQAAYQALRRGSLPGRKKGYHWQVELADVKEWLERYLDYGSGKEWYRMESAAGDWNVQLYMESAEQADRLRRLCLDLGYNGKVYKLFSAILNLEVKLNGWLAPREGSDRERFEALLEAMRLENPSHLARRLADGQIEVRKNNSGGME